MRCSSCARDNPQGSLFCQQCGRRLESAPTVEARPRAASVRCGRCGAEQAPHMRFCTECGSPIASPAAAPAPAPASPAVPDPLAARMSEAIGAPLCWHCRGVGDPGTEYCKFCGARYADGASAPASKATLMTSGPAIEGAGRLVSVLKDGTDGKAYPLGPDQTDIGKTEGEILLSDDPYLAPRHARIRRRGDTFVLRDL